MYIPRRKQKKRLDARSGQIVPMASAVPAAAYTYGSLSKVLSDISEKTLPAILSFYDKEAKLESESNLNKFTVRARDLSSKLVLDPTAKPEDANKLYSDLEEELKEADWAKGYEGIYGTQAKNELVSLKNKFNYNYMNKKYPQIERKSFENIISQYDLDTSELNIKTDGSRLNFLDNKLMDGFHSSVISNLELRVGKDEVTREMVYKEFERPEIKAKELLIEKGIKEKNFNKVKQQLNSDVDMGALKLSTLNKFTSLLDKKDITEISGEDFRKLGDPDLEYLLKLKDVGYSTENIKKELFNWSRAKLVTQRNSEVASIRAENVERGVLVNEGNVAQNAIVNGVVTGNKPYIMKDGTRITNLSSLNKWKTANLIPAETKKLSKLRESSERVKSSIVRQKLRGAIREQLKKDSNRFGPLTEANRTNVVELVQDIASKIPGADIGHAESEASNLINSYNRLSNEKKRLLGKMDSNVNDVFKFFDKLVLKKMFEHDPKSKDYKNRVNELQLSIITDLNNTESVLTDLDNPLSNKQAEEAIKKFYSKIQKDVHSFISDDIDEITKLEKKPILQVNDPLYRLKDSSFLNRAAHERNIIINSAARSLLEIAKRNKSNTLSGASMNALGSYHLLNILGGDPGDFKDATRSITFKKEEKIIDENRKEFSQNRVIK
jgi:hypothetical protein